MTYVYSFVGQEGVRALKRRFFVMGILNLVLMPFIMIFMLIFFFLKNAEELHSKKSVLGWGH
jgi:autophagy-related protein 9